MEINIWNKDSLNDLNSLRHYDVCGKVSHYFMATFRRAAFPSIFFITQGDIHYANAAFILPWAIACRTFGPYAFYVK